MRPYFPLLAAGILLLLAVGVLLALASLPFLMPAIAAVTFARRIVR